MHHHGRDTSPIIVMLGSSSKWRAGLVKHALPNGFELFEDRISPDIDEKAIRHHDASTLVLAIANAKADKLMILVKEKYNDSDIPNLIITCDQVIVCNGVIREKPENVAQAKEHLLSYGKTGHPAECISGVVVTNTKTGKRCSGVDIAKQYFNEIPESVADALIAKGDVMYCAGSFVAEDPLIQPYLGKLEGEIESVQGMPIALTGRLLEDAASH